MIRSPTDIDKNQKTRKQKIDDHLESHLITPLLDHKRVETKTKSLFRKID